MHRHAIRILQISIAAWATSGAAAAGDAFRQGVPPTLDPPRFVTRSTLEGAPWAELHRTLAARGRPRFALLWNVPLSDEVVDGSRTSRDSRTTRTGDHFLSEESAEMDTATRFEKGGFRERTTRQDVDETHSIELDVRSAGERAVDWVTEPIFTAELAQGGLRFVDKTITTRLGARATGSRDHQAAEIDGLVAHADYIIEVTCQPNPGTPMGRSFRVTVVAIQSGALLVDFLSDGEVRFSGGRPYVPSATGFAREAPPRANTEQAIRQLAVDTAKQLNSALR